MQAVLPYAADTESAVLGSILIHGRPWMDDAFSYAGGSVDREAFTSLFHIPEHHRVASIMADVAGGTSALNGPVLRDRLAATGTDAQRAAETVDRLVACGSLQATDDLRASCEELMSFRAARDMHRVLADGAGECLERGFTDPAQVLRRVTSALESVRMPMSNPPTVRDLLDKIESDSLPTWAVPTGLSELNDALNGGYASGRLYVIGAGTKVGKTTMMVSNIVEAITSGAAVAVASLETIEYDFAAKLLANMSELDRRSKVEPFLACDTPEQALELLGSQFTAEESEALIQARAMLRNAHLYPLFRDHLSQGFESMVSFFRTVRRLHPDIPCVAFVDHLNLLPEAGAATKTHEQLDRFTKDLFTLAQQEQMAVVSLVQLNAPETKSARPGLEQLRGSRAVGHNANTVILLDRDISEGDNDGDVADVHDLRVFIAANRNGPSRQFHAFFDGATDYVGDAETRKDGGHDNGGW